jgi:hypothetical protein
MSSDWRIISSSFPGISTPHKLHVFNAFSQKVGLDVVIGHPQANNLSVDAVSNH